MKKYRSDHVLGTTMRAILAYGVLAIMSQLQAGASTDRTSLITWNATTQAEASLDKNGNLNLDGQVLPARSEGQGSGPGDFTIVKDSTSSSGKVLHYLCKSQSDGHKARAEHYLHVEPMNTSFCSEFSVKLDTEFTKVDTKRPDNGPNWCILRQWHQCAPESPPLSLSIKAETNNVLVWTILNGDWKGHGLQTNHFGEKQIELGHWYHFRVKWRITPDENGQCVVMMSDKILPKDLTDADILFSYKGPIGYTLKGKPNTGTPNNGNAHGPFTIREQQGIYQGPHVDPATHHGFSVDNLAIYKLSAAPSLL